MLLFYLSLLNTDEDKNIFEKMYRNHYDAMYYTALNILKSQQKAEDAVHEAFLKIIESINKFNEMSCPQTKSFCVIISRNVSISMIRQEKKMAFDETENILEMIPDEKLTDEEVIKNMDWELLVDVVKSMPDIYSDVIYLRLVNGFSNKQVAKTLRLSEEAVKKRMQRGKAILTNDIRKVAFELV